MVMPAAVLRVVFFGTPEFAIPSLTALLGSRHIVTGVVTQPDRPKGRGQRPQFSPVKELGSAHGLPVLQPERLREPSFLEALGGLQADVGVVAAYGKILTDAVLQTPPLGLINVHGSLLPKYRGAAPVHRAVMAGETMTGVTIMRVVKALDAGPMLATVQRPIGPEDTSVDVEQDLAQLGAVALVRVLDDLKSGHLNETPQDESQATYAHKLQKSDGAINWAASAVTVHNLIRGLHPWPHAFADLQGARCLLLESRVVTERSEGDAGHASPGTILDAHGDTLTVQTGDGILRILRLQMEGRRPLNAREFLTGHRIPPGTSFTQPVL
jgi:methionyl-tRNA formyltransferase